jgi:dTDP-4-amino-4,6-dideoxygalactose transaminase
MHPAFSNDEVCTLVGDMTGSKYAFERCLALPLYHELSEADQHYVVENLCSLLK